MKKIQYKFYASKPASQLGNGDTITTEQGKQAVILDHYTDDGQKVFMTDRFGLVFENEIERQK